MEVEAIEIHKTMTFFFLLADYIVRWIINMLYTTNIEMDSERYYSSFWSGGSANAEVKGLNFLFFKVN